MKIGRLDSSQTGPISLWLSQCERLMLRIFQESNFYPAAATMWFDLVIFGSAVILIYEDFDDVIRCFNPCAGEYYLENSNRFKIDSFYREFTYTVSQVVQEFGKENVSPSIRRLYAEGGTSLTRELVVAHAIEPNDDGRSFGIPEHFKYREVYWEWGGSASPQGGSSFSPGLLRKRGYHESPAICPRWDLVSNDAYGRSPAMDALGDCKQLQLETRRKAQAIDKLVNPPLVADIQLKNQPASLLPGGITYINGMMSQGRPGFAPVYTVSPPVKEIMEDLQEVKERISKIFFNDLLRTASQYETRSNVTAMEWDMRKSESLVMLGPVYERVQDECLKPIIERVFAIASRAGIFPPAPPEIQGQDIQIEYISMLSLAQSAAQTSGIERLLQVAGGLVGVDPAVIDNIDLDFALDKMSELLNNDPRLIRSPEQLQQIRQMRQQQQQQAQQAEMAQKLAEGAKNLSATDVGGGQNALQRVMGG